MISNQIFDIFFSHSHIIHEVNLSFLKSVIKMTQSNAMHTVSIKWNTCTKIKCICPFSLINSGKPFNRRPAYRFQLAIHTFYSLDIHRIWQRERERAQFKLVKRENLFDDSRAIMRTDHKHGTTARRPIAFHKCWTKYLFETHCLFVQSINIFRILSLSLARSRSVTN